MSHPNDIQNYNDSGDLHGHVKVHYKNGNVSYEGNIIDGHAWGLWTEYWDNGQISHTGHYRDGWEVGCWVYYLPCGKISNKIYYIR